MQNHGVIIREIEDDEENGVPDAIIPEIGFYEEAEEHEVDDIDPLHNSLSEMDTSDIINPMPTPENATSGILGRGSNQQHSLNIHPREDIMEQTL